MTRVRKYSYRTRNATRKETLSVVSCANIVNTPREKKLSRKLLQDRTTSRNCEKSIKPSNKASGGSLRPKRIQPSFPAKPSSEGGDDSDKEVINNDVNKNVLNKVAPPARYPRGTSKGRRKEHKESILSPRGSDLYTRFGRKYTRIHQLAKKAGVNAVECDSPPKISSGLSDTVHHPRMSIPQCQQGQERQQKAMSGKPESITPRRSQTDVPSLRKPVVLLKANRFTARSETDSEFEGSDAEDSEFNRDVLRWSTLSARNSILPPDSSLRAIARAALPGNPGHTETLAESHKRHSEDSSSDEDAQLPKRRKVTAMDMDDQNHNSLHKLQDNPSSIYTPRSPSMTNSDISRIPGPDPVVLNDVDDNSPQPFQKAPIAPLMVDISSVSPFTDVNTIRTRNEDDTGNSSTVVIVVNDDADVIPARPRGQPIFSKIFQQMHSAYIAKHSATGPKMHRWITDPSNPNGPPIREKSLQPVNQNGAVYAENIGPNLSPTWHFCNIHGIDKKICTLEDIPKLVAAAYCDPRYTNEKQLISTLTQDYSGVRKEDIAWCMAGISAEGAPAESNPIPARPDGGEAAQLPPVPIQGDTGACPGNNLSSSTYWSPPISQSEGSPTVMDSADISQSVSSRGSTLATAEVGTQTSDPCQDRMQLDFMDPRNESLVKIMQAYRGGEYEKLLECDRDLGTRQDLDQQKLIELYWRISTLKSTIEKIETKGARFVEELANDLALDELRAVERDINVPKVRKRNELESVVAEHTQLLQRISEQAHDIVTVREELDTFVSNAKAHVKDVVVLKDGICALLAFLNGLPACKASV